MTIPPTQAGTVAFLEGLAGAPPLETQISAIFRGADTVWKLKKAVRLEFLDFTDVNERRRLLERELALNAAAAPGLYRDVVPVTRQGDGFALAGDGPAVDWVLRMARADASDFCDAMAAAGRLDPPMLVAMADAVAALHAAASPGAARASEPERLRAVLRGNLASANRVALNKQAVAAWGAAMAAAIDGAAPLLQARAPLVRRLHGDLHLGNMLLWHGRPAAFDALEFDEALATTDPGYDLAFLLMDLERRVSRAAADLVLSRYVAVTGDAALVGLLPVFLSMRAMVRAHVEAAAGGDGAALVAWARAALAPGRAVVVAVGGLMGTGKTTLARAVAPALGPAPGALVLRSDEVRKRLHGVGPEARLPPEAYGADATRRTEAALLQAMRDAVAGGHAVVLDASFLDPAFAASAQAAAGVPFLGVWLTAPLPLLEARVAARRGDASDATVAVLRQAAAHAAPPLGWRVLDACRADLQDTVQAAAAVL